MASASKEQSLGDFRRKLREADCPVHQIEPYTQFSNRAEALNREFKKQTGRRLTSSGSPKQLWDDCVLSLRDKLSLILPLTYGTYRGKSHKHLLPVKLQTSHKK